MKKINDYILEKLHINKDTKFEEENPTIEVIKGIKNYFINKCKIKETEFKVTHEIDSEKMISVWSNRFNDILTIDNVAKDIFNLFKEYIKEYNALVTTIYFILK